MNRRRFRRQDLYRIPWSPVDNVNGWIEPIYRCNLKCTACYRLGQDEAETFETMQRVVDQTIEHRNCEHISIAGGEPLLVDYLDDLIRYIKARGCRVTVLTNGLLLDDRRLAALRSAGLDRINLHVDSGQNRPGWEGRSEVELLELKQRYVDLIHGHGVQCGLISVVYERTLQQIPEIVRWAVSNAGKVANVTFDMFRYYPDPQYVRACFSDAGCAVDPALMGTVASVADERRLTVDDVLPVLYEALPDYRPHSYLNGAQRQDVIKWLLATAVVLDAEVLGFIGPRAVELGTVWRHFRDGRYPSFVGGRPRRTIFLAAAIDRDLRKAFGVYARRCLSRPARLLRGIQTLSIAVVQPADWYTDGVQNMCDSCPDAMLWEGLLVPSCRLDEYKRFGGLLHMAFEDWVPRNHTDLNAALGARPPRSAASPEAAIPNRGSFSSREEPDRKA